jgi:hypothetical protein
MTLGALGLNWGKANVTTTSAEPQNVSEPAPPADQQYIGTKKCAACHFDQFTKWKKTKHSKTFELLPAKYQADAKCLKCHTTGFGEPTGYKTAADKDLVGTSCEACHGPGSKHAEISKPFANQKPNPEQDKLCRDSIWKVQPKNSCIACHMIQGHHDSLTPLELRKK